ncbi:6-phosphogluconolactonase-like [Anneissia japonica]|uniref:6-phosphogluconolactonase-like n=1 Tax=Anneissia japonica TaxID=1529436 RepID=UPI00142582AB|nr:6-phosphogluconolactonase-like [Anneissia japonica]
MAMASKKVYIEEEDNVASMVCSFIADLSRKTVQEKGAFYIGVSGGSAAKIFCNGLSAISDLQWDKWHIYFCDERVVDFNNADSTYKFYKENLIGKVNLPESQLYAIDPSLDLEDIAIDYAKKIDAIPKDKHGLPVFDLLILGMGPDGHTCSLFPDHKLLEEKNLTVASISDSPKPPQCRITLTFPVINVSKSALFISMGASKAEMVARILEGNESNPLPAARVQLKNGLVHWFLDKAASASLKGKY